MVVLAWNAERYVDACLGSLARADRGGAAVEVLLVDNGSSDGTVRRVRERHPEVTLVETGENLGFAEGNNVGIRRALEHGADFVHLLNPDTEVDPAFLTAALAVLREDPGCAAAQSLLLLGAEPELVNTAGNRIHFLGFGYCGAYRRPAAGIGPDAVEIPFPSGASTLYRASALRAVGLLDPRLFLYQEDMDLGWRLRLAGHRCRLAPGSRVLHHYEFSRSPRKYYFLERNRHWVLLKNLRVRNLLLLAPLLLAAEAGLLLLAALGGWLPQKLRAYRDAFRPSALRGVLRDRRDVQAHRAVPDREIARHLTGAIDFEGAAPAWAQRGANAVLGLAWWLLRPLFR